MTTCAHHQPINRTGTETLERQLTVFLDQIRPPSEPNLLGDLMDMFDRYIGGEADLPLEEQKGPPQRDEPAS